MAPRCVISEGQAIHKRVVNTWAKVMTNKQRVCTSDRCWYPIARPQTHVKGIYTKCRVVHWGTSYISSVNNDVCCWCRDVGSSQEICFKSFAKSTCKIIRCAAIKEWTALVHWEQLCWCWNVRKDTCMVPALQCRVQAVPVNHCLESTLVLLTYSWL